MRVVFWGSPAFAVPTLEALAESEHEVVAVVTQPDRRRGRGGGASPTPVRRTAERAGIEVATPEKPRGDDFMAWLEDRSAEAFVVAAYGEILSPDVLAIPDRGAFNVHASLLPAYRGAAPVVQAILDGLDETGITIMRMDAGLDTGPICLQSELAIAPDDSAGTVTRRLAALGAPMMVEALDRVAEGTLVERPQDDAKASYAPKVTTERARIDWTDGSSSIDRAVRAFDPWPGAWTTWRDARLKILRVRPVRTDRCAVPGTLIAGEGGPVVATGDGAVELARVQPAGRAEQSGVEWARGRRPEAGERLGEPSGSAG